MSDRLHERAPAKLNLCLYVGDRRADGLHEICSLFVPLTLADRVTLEPAAGEADEVVCPGVEQPDLAARALAAFRERFDWRGEAVRITIDKEIPLAAGLGGGSADAAAAIRLALRASGIGATTDELRELATGIGADVTSQLEPRLALVTGAGERVEPLKQDLTVDAVLLAGRDGLSSADVYAHADSMFPPRSNLAELGDRIRAAVAAATNALELGELLHNDLQGSAVTLEPSAGEALDLVRASGARAALVAGSGPTVAGLYEDAAAAATAATALRAQWGGAVLVAQTGTTR